MSYRMFWAQCETILSSDWHDINNIAHRFRFSKKGKESFPSMNLLKSSFLLNDGGFNTWIPSIRTEVSAASLFFYLLQESKVLSCQSEWIWLKNVVNVINKLDLIPKIVNFSQM
eukprot:TRINITY_DN4204_c0_g1_i27.p1 TRINITY_DN4204_c0_g1~~TRINITY_DN4204_c0_g1_i27.p1  ORF type:complete len:114 (+),score=11.45 TRINITY_DN4204_c0_g1_i27:543-884(+)